MVILACNAGAGSGEWVCTREDMIVYDLSRCMRIMVVEEIYGRGCRCLRKVEESTMLLRGGVKLYRRLNRR